MQLFRQDVRFEHPEARTFAGEERRAGGGIADERHATGAPLRQVIWLTRMEYTSPDPSIASSSSGTSHPMSPVRLAQRRARVSVPR